MSHYKSVIEQVDINREFVSLLSTGPLASYCSFINDIMLYCMMLINLWCMYVWWQWRCWSHVDRHWLANPLFTVVKVDLNAAEQSSLAPTEIARDRSGTPDVTNFCRNAVMRSIMLRSSKPAYVVCITELPDQDGAHQCPKLQVFSCRPNVHRLAGSCWLVTQNSMASCFTLLPC